MSNKSKSYFININMDEELDELLLRTTLSSISVVAKVRRILHAYKHQYCIANVRKCVYLLSTIVIRSVYLGVACNRSVVQTKEILEELLQLPLVQNSNVHGYIYHTLRALNEHHHFIECVISDIVGADSSSHSDDSVESGWTTTDDEPEEEGESGDESL